MSDNTARIVAGERGLDVYKTREGLAERRLKHG